MNVLRSIEVSATSYTGHSFMVLLDDVLLGDICLTKTKMNRVVKTEKWFEIGADKILPLKVRRSTYYSYYR